LEAAGNEFILVYFGVKAPGAADDAQFNFILYDTAIPTFSSTVSFKALDEQMKKQ